MNLENFRELRIKPLREARLEDLKSRSNQGNILLEFENRRRREKGRRKRCGHRNNANAERSGGKQLLQNSFGRDIPIPVVARSELDPGQVVSAGKNLIRASQRNRRKTL
ncbi:hypothetical protein K0M31_002482 [Melipona bicolor]|uniref:Uncharacterized protein n=1 Tax=Melipona bicolor TaxID=60889 RepID=A0AA40KYW4_9HYME|nr:hypothetical protein K0M31_002482 [Melipona bicolor]